MKDLLEVSGLCLQFGGLTVLDEVSLRVPEGGVTAIIGPNGAGKTSLFNSVSGNYRPHAGRIVFAGADITRLPAARRAALGVARTFQNIALFPSMTVLDNVKLGRHVHLRSGVLAGALYLGRARREERRLEAYIEREVVELLGIREILGESAAALPYGLRKRVELARAVAMEPRPVPRARGRLRLAEPAAGLSHGDREQMMRLIRDLQRLRGITLLLVEHDMHVVMDLADQVVVLDFGRVIAAGTPAQVREDPAVIAAYLGAESEQAS